MAQIIRQKLSCILTMQDMVRYTSITNLLRGAKDTFFFTFHLTLAYFRNLKRGVSNEEMELFTEHCKQLEFMEIVLKDPSYQVIDKFLQNN